MKKSLKITWGRGGLLWNNFVRGRSAKEFLHKYFLTEDSYPPQREIHSNSAFETIKSYSLFIFKYGKETRFILPRIPPPPLLSRGEECRIHNTGIPPRAYIYIIKTSGHGWKLPVHNSKLRNQFHLYRGRFNRRPRQIFMQYMRETSAPNKNAATAGATRDLNRVQARRIIFQNHFVRRFQNIYKFRAGPLSVLLVANIKGKVARSLDCPASIDGTTEESIISYFLLTDRSAYISK